MRNVFYEKLKNTFKKIIITEMYKTPIFSVLAIHLYVSVVLETIYLLIVQHLYESDNVCPYQFEIYYLKYST